ncbi:response regulator [Pontibacter sp. G13]|uniref:response regulator n=1 Tax=Pontibacter sp. G13 TaxID=3074898 RepID=UPI00288C11BF|nr:response regulator [Pontibacter sp. G13]WNJ18603.1 response regulator [Pontibacter sp. G13]
MADRKGRILIIDDDEGILLTLRILLRRHFAEIVTANTPHKITQLLSQGHFHVIILDMNYSVGATSGKEGFHWLQQIREQSPESQVVLMTAYGDVDLAIKAMKLGAADFVIKPWENDKLLDTILSAFKQNAHLLPHSNNGTETPEVQEACRIFMFLDIKSSTRIAEELGHVKYFELLNQFFADVSDPIAAHQGEIYQYVGDQVVVTWPLDHGAEEAKCLKCFFAIEDQMAKLSEKYVEKFGLSPTFKAGMHFGDVSQGYIGTLKKERIFSGDVLNTTSRIEGLCNRYSAKLLVSQNLMQELPDDHGFEFQIIGDFVLRGKQQTVSLCHVDRVKQT